MQILNNRWYDVLKWISIICLPALSSFVVVISKIWRWEDLGSMIAQTITAVAVLLGALLGVSSHLYRGNNDDKD